MEDTFLEDNENTNPQLTEKFFIKSQYQFFLNCMKKNMIILFPQHFASPKPTIYLNKFNHFSLIFNFLAPKELDLHCSHQIMLPTKQTHTYTYYKLTRHHYIINTP